MNRGSARSREEGSRLSWVVVLVALCAGRILASCDSSTTPTPLVLLDTTVTLQQGITCNIGYVGAEFVGTAGKTVVITAAGAVTLTPHFTLYAPDYATELGGSSPALGGSTTLTFALTQPGLHHLSLCDANGVAGTLRVTVTQP